MTVVKVRTPQRVRLKGSEDEVRALLVGYIAAGRLLPDGLLDQGELRDGRCYADVRLLPLPQPARRKEISPNVFLGGFLSAAALVGGAWVVFLFHHAAVVLLVAVGVLLAWVGLGQVGACPGVHCPGCKHR